MRTIEGLFVRAHKRPKSAHEKAKKKPMKMPKKTYENA